ncbi:MAG: InlB B-repeat-containing protein [Muribaculaceae bacterium]|nr:InlB B-repeat-containing protein [Muribaculaceae bacterium]
MRIRSNQAEGETIDFLLRNKETGDTVVLRRKDGQDILFKADDRLGYPSDPIVMERCFSVSVKTEGKGTVEFTDGYYPAGTVVELKAIPAEGYHFEGWSNGAAEETLSITLEDNVDLTATFAPNIYKAVFMLNGEEYATLDIPCDAAVEAPEVAQQVGYTFSGWAELPEVMPPHDITVNGTLSVNYYKLVFKIDNEEIYSAEVEYDAPIAAPEAPAKEGYTFNGWGEVPATMPAHDVEIYSTYTVNYYKLTFELDGETVFSEDMAYGTAIVAPETPAREGYTFSGWSELPSTMPAADTVITGAYAVNSYKLTFKVDGEVIFSEDVNFGSPVTAPEAPEKTGYTFNGWGELPETMPSHDVEMHSTYTINSYKLTFKLDGEEIYSEELVYGTAITAPEVAEKIGYTFSGWGEVPETMPAEDTVYSGEYIVNIYNVTYKIDGEVAYHAEVEYGAEVPVFTPDDKDGYTFSGWGLAIPSVMPAKDLEFNGFFDINMFAITFRIGGTVINSQRLPYGAEIVAPEAPAKEGYTFSGWNDCPATMPAKDVVVDGDYTVNRYKVTYRIEDVDFYTEELEYGAPIVAPEAPEKEGHAFSGWGDIPATMPAFDLVFGGTYDDHFYRLTFRIDGIVIYTDDLVFGAPFTAPDAPEKEGYTFNGWGEVPATMPAANLEFDGSYTVNTYAVTFRIGDEVIYEGSLAYGAEIVVPEAPAKEGHTFGGWGIVPATMPSSDLLITGDYTVNSYTLTYRIGEEDFFTTSVPYGAEITAPEAPAREGYTFSGWNGLPSTMPASDLAVSGSYAANSYKLTFRIGEDVVFAGELLYGTEIQTPEAPAKEGHTFAGWGMVPATMPAADLDVVGQYDVNIYNLTYRIDDVDFFTTQIAYGSEITAPEAPAKEGHTFLGWSDAVTTMPANDLIISGSYSINSYKLIFRIGEDIVFEGDMLYGSEIQIPDAPAKEGFVFAGWGMVPSTMPASDLEFVGTYDAKLYTLTFDIDGEVFYQTQLPYGAEITAPAEVPEKDGNQFGGWGNVPTTMPGNDLVISGTYSANHYTVTFRIGEEILFTGQQPYGSEIIVPEVPVREGYSFSGWGEVPAVVPAHDLEFTGKYEVNSYRIVFSIDDEVILSEVVEYGAAITAPEVEPKEGHTFSGWGVVPATMPASDLYINGKYEVNLYSVVFRIGEEVVYSTQVPFGGSIETPAAPVKEGHTFTGWGEVPAAMPAHDLVFEGKYDVNLYKLSFVIDGEVISASEVAYGAEVSVPEAPAKKGHSFTGWGVVPATMPAADLVITGAYEVNVYNVVFKLGEEVIASTQLPYGAEIAVPAAPEKEGHSFSGWGDVPAVMPDSDLEFNGEYAVNSYKVTFRIDDKVIAESLIPYGSELIVPAAPEKIGHTFAGWGIVPATMPASDLEFTGVYDVNLYTVIFMINDEVVYSAQLAYGAEIVAPAVTVYDGFIFSGWSEFPSTVPDHDVTVTGTMTESGTVAVDGMPEGEVLITVYSLDGVVLYKDVKASDIEERLTPGIYIINGKKMVVR